MNKLEDIYKVEGVLNRNFVGHISYIVCLDKVYENIRIDFSFDKQKVNEITDEIKEVMLLDYINDHNGELVEELNEERFREGANHMKTEIHISAFLNDRFIGGIHRQLIDRIIYISSKEATNGAICQDDIQGVLKINVMVFNVIYDNTQYKLSVSGDVLKGVEHV